MTQPLSPVVRRYLLGVGVGRFGTGMTLPFAVILLHEVRGLPLTQVGLLLAIPGVLGLAVVPLGGALVDRFGPRAVLAVCLSLMASGTALLAVAQTRPLIALALLVNGVGLGPSFPAANALLSGLVTDASQVRHAFGLQFTVLNAAIGAGSLVGALVADVSQASTFTALYLAAACAVLVQVLLLPAAERPVHDTEAAPPSYREVLADGVFRRVCLLSLLFALTGYAALDSGLPAFARVVGGASTTTIALAFTVNTVLIVSLQLPVIRLIASWRRTTALAVAALAWASSWLLLGLSQGTWAVLAFGALFGLGEVFNAPAMVPLVNALATDRLRGRYNALSGAMFSVAFVVSPALSGLLIGHGLGTVWITGLVLGSVATAVVVTRLRPLLTDVQDGLAPAVVAAG